MTEEVPLLRRISSGVRVEPYNRVRILTKAVKIFDLMV